MPRRSLANLKMPEGNALFFSVRCASESDIAVPAAMGIAVPEVNPILYICMALALTFPFNTITGYSDSFLLNPTFLGLKADYD